MNNINSTHMNILNKNIQRAGKILSIILLVLFILCLVSTGFDIFSLMNGHTGEEIAHFSGEILGNLFVAGMLFFAWMMFWHIGREYTPFSPKHTLYLRLISLLMLAYTIIVPPVEMLMTEILAPGVEASASIELSGIVCAVIFYCLALIFDYGRLLQKQSDETM